MLLVAPLPPLPRSRTPLCVALPTCDLPGVEIVLPSSEELAEAAGVIVCSFQGTTPPAPPMTPQSPPPLPLPTAEPSLLARPLRRSSLVDEEQRNSASAEFILPDQLAGQPQAVIDRWRSARKGLQWRLGARLAPAGAFASGARQLDTSANLEASLLLALRDCSSAALVATAELSIRPLDGKLVEEFAVPALFSLHDDAALGAYISNVAVLPRCRQRGYASALLCACEEIVAKEWKMQEVHLHYDVSNPNAAKLYAAYEPLPAFDDACRPAGVPRGMSAPAGTLNRYHRKTLVGLG